MIVPKRQTGRMPLPVPPDVTVAHEHIALANGAFYGLVRRHLVAPDGYRTRFRCYAWPRQNAMYLTWRLTDLSLTKIGCIYGGRDHTTVLSSIRAVERRLTDRPVQAKTLRAIAFTAIGIARSQRVSTGAMP